MVQMSGMPRPAGAGPGSPKKTAAQFVAMNKSDGLGGNPWARTAPRTGTSFDMADLLTNGMATKVPRPVLPSTNAKMEVLGRTEQTMPGDILGKKESATAIVDRMATIIRSRNLDLLNLMDDFLKRPRGSRMPIRNRAFLDVSTFRRALCYAFGDQWLGLNMSSTEFETIWKKYERKDASNQAEMLAASGRGKGYQGGSDYGAGQGQPESLILWQQFAQDVQRYTDGDNRSDAEKLLLEAELALMAKSEAAEAAALSMHDADDNYGDAQERMRKRQAKKAEMANKPVGMRGCTVGQVASAKKIIQETLTGAGGKYDTVREALRDIDNGGDGILTREEVKLLLNEHFLLKYVDFYTGMTRGKLDEVVVDTLLDECDLNGDGKIECDEFAKVVLAGSNSYFFEDMADSFESTSL